MKIKYLNLILIFIFLSLSQLMVGKGFKTLIDFQTYEEKNKEENIYIKDDQSFRKKIYENPNSIKAKEQIEINNRFIPWFKITPSDMTLDRWVISYSLPVNYQTQPSKLTMKAYAPFYKIKEKKIKMLGARIHFPKINGELSASVSPPYEIYSYNLQGKLSNIKNGVLNNVGDIEKISVTLGFKGKINNSSIFVKLENNLGDIKEYPLGYLYYSFAGNTKYFEKFDGFTFEKEIDRNEIKKSSLYYKVFYKKNIPVLWIIFKHQKAVYHEITLEWTNSNYLPISRKKVNRKQLYPNEIPYIKFHSIVVKKRDESTSRQMYLFFKNIKVKHDLAVPEEHFLVDDDKAWDEILGKYKRQKRQNLEKIHAARIYNMMKEGWAIGFVGYDNFKEYYFLRFPPKKDY